MVEALIGVAGAVLVAYVSYRLGERAAGKRSQEQSRDEDLDLRLYARIVGATKDGSVFNPDPDPDSDNFKRAIRLCERGLLERLPLPGRCYFTLPGAQIKLDTSRPKD